MKKIPEKLLRKLGLLKHGRTRFYARYVDGAPGKFAEFWLGSIQSLEDDVTELKGRATDEWLEFFSHAAGSSRLLQFGVEMADGAQYLCRGSINEYQVSATEEFGFTIEQSAPWALVDGATA